MLVWRRGGGRQTRIWKTPGRTHGAVCIARVKHLIIAHRDLSLETIIAAGFLCMYDGAFLWLLLYPRFMYRRVFRSRPDNACVCRQNTARTSENQVAVMLG